MNVFIIEYDNGRQYEVDPEWIVEMVADYPPQEYAADTCYRDGCRL